LKAAAVSLPVRPIPEPRRHDDRTLTSDDRNDDGRHRELTQDETGKGREWR